MKAQIREFYGRTFDVTDKLLIIDGDIKAQNSPRLHMTGWQLMDMLRDVESRRRTLEKVEANIWAAVEGAPSGESVWPLSDQELVMVLSVRAKAMTGYDVHRRGDCFYIWPMGQQPVGQQLEEILGKSPVEAAYKFLAIYKTWEAAGSPFHHCVVRQEVSQ